MSLTPIHSSSMATKYDDPSALDTRKLKGRDVAGGCTAFQKANINCSVYDDRKSHFLHHATLQDNSRKLRTGAGVLYIVYKRIEMPCKITNCLPLHQQTVYSSESSSTVKQLGALNSYFQKLRNETQDQQTSFVHSQDSDTALISDKIKVKQSPTETTELPDSSFDTKKELSSLEIYLGKLNAKKTQEKISTSEDNITKETPTGTPYHAIGDFGRDEAKERKIHLQSQSTDNKSYPEISQSLQPQEETSDLYLICILASINIAVFLFEIATPVKNSDLELLTLPSLYGAKINQLILDGEWWRLVTPMFLHSGIFHVALGSWVLLTFGPQVCKGYGSLTFLLIYILGGISGNVTSYIHTPEPTVGGTGPVFAIIGAWIIYQIQKKEVAQKDILDSMYQKAIIATAFSFVISSLGPIDNWTHLGATFVGVAYGYLNCPTLQLGGSSSKTDHKDQLAFIKQHAGPCKSVATFVIFLGIISSLLLFVEPQVNSFL